MPTTRCTTPCTCAKSTTGATSTHRLHLRQSHSITPQTGRACAWPHTTSMLRYVRYRVIRITCSMIRAAAAKGSAYTCSSRVHGTQSSAPCPHQSSSSLHHSLLRTAPGEPRKDAVLNKAIACSARSVGMCRTASSSDRESGTTCKLRAGIVRYSAIAPSFPMMPSTVRPGAWLRVKTESAHVKLQMLQFISPTTRLPTSCGCELQDSTCPTCDRTRGWMCQMHQSQGCSTFTCTTCLRLRRCVHIAYG